jgi:hypothetical protein
MYISNRLFTNIIDKVHKLKYIYKIIRTFLNILFKKSNPIVINIFLQKNKIVIFDFI